MGAELRFLEFFAGAGLVRLALAPDWRCVWANDIDPRKAAVYVENFGAAELVVDDVARILPERLPGHSQLAWASFPCQDLSLAGWRRGMSAERSGTFWAFWHIMRDLFDADARPPVIVIENVVGLLYGDNFNGLCEAFAALNMRFGAVVIDARWFVPQSRPRVFFVAVDAGLKLDPYEELLPEGRPWFTKPIWKAWRDLPPPLASRWIWWRLPVPVAPVAPIEDLIEYEPDSVRWHSSAETQRLLDLMAPINRERVERALAASDRSVGFLYKRTRSDGQRAEVRFDGIAGCLRTPEGGSSRQTIVVVEDGAVRSRLLSTREAARLMGAPDSFQLPSRYNDAYRAMGDGVAVPAVAWLAQHLLTPLAHDALAKEQQAGGDGELVHAHVSAARDAAEALAMRWSGGRE